MQPAIRYAKSGDVHIAYQVVGDGPIDLVHIPGFVSHLEHAWEDPSLARFYRRLASFSRLILLDKRGTGLSDRLSEVASLEQRMDDVRAVMDAVGVERASVFGVSEGGTMSLLFAATYPERTSALILYGSGSRWLWAPDYPWAQTTEQWEQSFKTIADRWGEPMGINSWAPSRSTDERFRQWLATFQRLGASPGAVIALWRMNMATDVRPILPTINTPTLLLHRVGDGAIKVGHSRYMAERIPGAKYVELPGEDHLWWTGDADAILNQVEEFLTGTRHVVEIDRVLATILFTDIVGSTEQLAQVGDRRWSELLGEHFRLARHELARHRGREIKTTGDGLLATFDGPARAIRCASAIRNGTRQLGIEIRAGVHTGEVEVLDEDLGGIAVHTGARVAAEAGPGEVLVSSTVKDLVAGSGIAFDDRGAHSLKGVPGEWRLFRVLS
jgi:class 3 adenylate cyclase